MVWGSSPPSSLELLEDAAPAARASTRLISIVVPLFNEEATLAVLYEQLRAVLDSKALPWEVVYVDDGSTDVSHRQLVRLHAAHTNVRVVRLRRNFGKAAAFSAGFEAAAGDVVITMDADLQ